MKQTDFQNETILCVAPRRWDSLWRETQQIMSRLSKNNKVIYLDPGDSNQMDAGSKMVKALKSLRNVISPQYNKINNNLMVVSSPPSLPYFRRFLPQGLLKFWLPFAVWLNARVSLFHINRVLSVKKVDEPILWVHHPFSLSLVRELNLKLSCYYNYDEFSDMAHSWRIKPFLEEREKQFCEAVDVIFATSTAQEKKRLAWNENTYFVPNAVDFELFNQALSNIDLAKDITDIPRPIMGFAGWLGYHIDVALLLKLAQRYPDYSLVLVGPDELTESEQSKALKKLSNVYFLGMKAKEALPSYLKAFDVALMPWALSGHIKSAYPLKLHEYLAAGRSALATDLPELAPFKDYLYIAKDQEDFIEAIPECLNRNDSKSIYSREAIASQNTWEHRVKLIEKILLEQL